MSVLTNELTLGDLLKYEEESLYSRDQVTVAAGQNLRIGTVLGRVDANGKVKALDPAATDGTQIATAVLLQSVDATTGEKSSGIAATRQAIVAHDCHCAARSRRHSRSSRSLSNEQSFPVPRVLNDRTDRRDQHPAQSIWQD